MVERCALVPETTAMPVVGQGWRLQSGNWGLRVGLLLPGNGPVEMVVNVLDLWG